MFSLATTSFMVYGAGTFVLTALFSSMVIGSSVEDVATGSQAINYLDETVLISVIMLCTHVFAMAVHGALTLLAASAIVIRKRHRRASSEPVIALPSTPMSSTTTPEGFQSVGEMVQFDVLTAWLTRRFARVDAPEIVRGVPVDGFPHSVDDQELYPSQHFIMGFEVGYELGVIRSVSPSAPQSEESEMNSVRSSRTPRTSHLPYPPQPYSTQTVVLTA
jgi:hypothetical protein